MRIRKSYQTMSAHQREVPWDDTTLQPPLSTQPTRMRRIKTYNNTIRLMPCISHLSFPRLNRLSMYLIRPTSVVPNRINHTCDIECLCRAKRLAFTSQNTDHQSLAHSWPCNLKTHRHSAPPMRKVRRYAFPTSLQACTLSVRAPHQMFLSPRKFCMPIFDIHDIRMISVIGRSESRMYLASGFHGNIDVFSRCTRDRGDNLPGRCKRSVLTVISLEK